MQRTKVALVHTGQIALVVGCCGLSALVATRLASTSLELMYSSWGGPRVALVDSKDRQARISTTPDGLKGSRPQAVSAASGLSPMEIR